MSKIDVRDCQNCFSLHDFSLVIFEAKCFFLSCFTKIFKNTYNSEEFGLNLVLMENHVMRIVLTKSKSVFQLPLSHFGILPVDLAKIGSTISSAD